jgi:hypothetical protein
VTQAVDSTALRVFVYDWLLARGVPPSTSVIASHFDTTVDAARQSLADLKIGKTILTHACSGEIWMAGPFSAVPTPYRVFGSKVAWWANCAWDMFGIAMLAREPVRIETTCTDCGDHMSLDGSPDSGPSGEGVVHFLIPAARWYADIGFT